METYPAEHFHAVGKRAPEDGPEDHLELGDGPVGRSSADSPGRGPVRSPAAEAQQEADFSVAEVGECVGGSPVSGRR